MSAYVIGHFTVHDKDHYNHYRSEFFPIFKRFGGELVAVDDDGAVMEGELPAGRTVILRFPDVETAKSWWSSDDYQRISGYRKDGVVQHFMTIINDKPAGDPFA